jgi:hypothetical protein
LPAGACTVFCESVCGSVVTVPGPAWESEDGTDESVVGGVLTGELGDVGVVTGEDGVVVTGIGEVVVGTGEVMLGMPVTVTELGGSRPLAPSCWASC